jgi:hypothetical protein
MFDALTVACRRKSYHGFAFISAAAESATGGECTHVLSSTRTWCVLG